MYVSGRYNVINFKLVPSVTYDGIKLNILVYNMW